MTALARIRLIAVALVCGVGVAAWTGSDAFVTTKAGTVPDTIKSIGLQTRRIALVANVTNSGGKTLGSYSVTMTWDSAVVRIDSVTSGTYTAPSVNYVNGGELRLAAAKATGGSATVDTLAYLFVHSQDVPAGSHTVIAPSFTELTATDFSDLLPQLTTLSTVARIVTPTVPVSISPDSIHVVSGDTPYLDVVVDLSQTANGTALGSYTAAVTWDSTVMRLDSATSANFPTSQFNPQNAGWLKLSGADATGTSGANVVVARLFFRFVNDTFPAETNVGLSVTELHAAESFADLLPGVQVHGGYAFIGGVVRGDLDESGVVDALDAQLILQGAVDLPLPNGLSGLPFGDADCDGALRALDAQIVLNYVVDNDVSQFCVGKIQ